MWSVENEECRKCGVWKMRSVENVECRKCGEWKTRNVENAVCGKCGVWKMRSVFIGEINIIYFEELPIFLLTYKYRTKFVTSLLRASMNSPT